MASSSMGVRLFGLSTGLAICLAGASVSALAQVPAKKGATAKAKAKAKGSMPAKDEAASPPAVEDPNGLKFSRDIAPIFVGNCIGCHGTEKPKKQFSLATFEKLMAGGESGKVIVPKDAEGSLLVQHIKAENGLRKMPPGNQRTLAPETIARIETWITNGAILDAKIDPTAPLSKIAATPEDRRRSELAKLSPEARDKKVEEAGLDRWKKATSKTTPEITLGKNFALFSNLPKKRADALIKALEAERTALASILGPASGVLGGPEKISLYVFNEPSAYVEFVRGVENREIEAGNEAHGNLLVESPYLVSVDPLNGRDEPPASKKKTKDADEGPERSLPALLAEQLGVGASNAAGKPPKWLSLGLGAYLSSRVESRSPYLRKLRETAGRSIEIGWTPKANEALGGDGELETVRAMGFSLVEWLATAAKPVFPGFVRAMLQGQEKLDDTIRLAFNDSTREQFIETWGAWVSGHYPTRRRR